jgi:hypothetical protein
LGSSNQNAIGRLFLEALLFHQWGPAGTDMLTDASLTILLERLIGFCGRLSLLAAVSTR